MNETTEIVHRSDGKYDLRITNGKEIIEKNGVTLSEIVFELEMMAYQRRAEQ